MNAPLRLLAALFSAALLALSLPNEFFRLGLPLLGFLALIPLYLALVSAPDYRSAARLCALFGALTHVLCSYWLFFYKDFAFWTVGGSALAYAAIYYVFGLYLGFFLRKSGRFRPLAFALLWTSFEYLKSTGFLGYPWGLLPYSQTTLLPLLQVAELTGVYGLSLVLSLANAALAELFPVSGGRSLFATTASTRGKRSGRPILPRPLPLVPALRLGWLGLALASLALLYAFGEIRLATLPAPAASIRILIVQQNIDPWLEGEEPTLAANVRLAARALAENEAAGREKPELIVFSEGSLRRPWDPRFMRWFAQRPLEDPLLPFLARNGIPLLTGAPVVLDWNSWEATNSSILVDPSGRLLHDYAKTHPVPFAEAIPFWEFPAFRKFMQETVGLESGWTMGSAVSLFPFPSSAGLLRFGSPICFEDAFSDVCREMALLGADFLLNLTNDAWSRTVSAELQHYAAARFRAIELRMPLLRSTNAGLSCVIDARGALTAELPLFSAEARIVELPLAADRRTTVFEAYGDWFALSVLSICALWTAILIGADLKRPQRRRRR